MSDVEYLNNTVWCTIGPSDIHGVGVFAIRDIPKGMEISDWNAWEKKKPRIFTLDFHEFYQLDPAIREIITQRTYYPKDIPQLVFPSPNHEVSLRSFMNHSTEPNTDGFIALRDIKKGEELMENYLDFYEEGLHELSKI